MFVENLTQTLTLGERLSQKLKPLSIVLLRGPIGSGKTSFVQGIARGLSISEDVTSPTFALSNHYNSGKIPLFHLDLYRLENVATAQEFFLTVVEEAHENPAIIVIEWPELIQSLIESSWNIDINYAKNYGRNYTIRNPKNSLTSS